jgi:hypothetical protein
MLSINRLLFLILVFPLFTACGVSSFKAQNWSPNDHSDLSTELYRSKYLEICRHQAQQLESSNNEKANKAPEITERYANFNKSLLNSCMEAKGYKLRELTGTEIFIDTVTAPLELPLMVIGKNIDDIY